ncbi:hypothetical protein HDU98_007687 [Podochytrium sp. JEL0797]|nr:hypothetical protein HDU98_007687 [Podochytrium sp. JEL0797]
MIGLILLLAAFARADNNVQSFPFASSSVFSHSRSPPAGFDTFSTTELVALCHEGSEWTIDKHCAVSTASNPSDPLAVQRSLYLGHCAPLEIMVHQDGRSMGHCSDFAQYILHADARLNPEFDDATNTLKLKLCPRSTFLHFESARPFFFSNSTTHRNFWAPNLEQISKTQSSHFERTSKVLCKTKIACLAIRKYLKANGLLIQPDLDSPWTIHSPDPFLAESYDPSMSQFTPFNAQLVYMSHSSLDLLDPIPDFATTEGPPAQNFTQFIHIHGTSGRKSTVQLYNCWKRHPEWPKLVIVGNRPREGYEKEDNTKGPVPDNIDVYTRLEARVLRDLQRDSGVHVCPSNQEGYGHYINEARSLGALVVTTDHAPMNELVVDGESGVLIGHKPPVAEDYQLFQEPYFVSPVHVSSDAICAAVEKVIALSLEERQALGAKAREAYEYDRYLMETRMGWLRKEAAEYLRGMDAYKQAYPLLSSNGKAWICLFNLYNIFNEHRGLCNSADAAFFKDIETNTQNQMLHRALSTS